MARKKQGGGLLLLLLLIVGFLIVAFAAISSVVLVLILIYWWIKAALLPKTKGLDAFVMTTREAALHKEAQEETAELQSELAGLWSQGVDLTKRQDGYFSEKSKLGKALNAKIQVAEARLSKCQSISHRCENYNTSRVKRYFHTVSMKWAMIMTTMVYAGVTLYVLDAPPEWVKSFSAFLDESAGVGTLMGIKHAWGAMTLAAVAGLASLAITKTSAQALLLDYMEKKKINDPEKALVYSEKLARVTGIGEV